MRTTRSSWTLLLGAAFAVMTAVCVLERMSPPAVAPTRSALPDWRPPSYAPVQPAESAPFRRPPAPRGNRPTFQAPYEFPNLHHMILYTPPGFKQ